MQHNTLLRIVVYYIVCSFPFSLLFYATFLSIVQYLAALSSATISKTSSTLWQTIINIHLRKIFRGFFIRFYFCYKLLMIHSIVSVDCWICCICWFHVSTFHFSTFHHLMLLLASCILICINYYLYLSLIFYILFMIIYNLLFLYNILIS